MDDFSKIKVGNHLTGIIGLKAVLTEMVQQYQDEPKERISVLMREKLTTENYIAKGAEHLYEEAFLREYMEFAGLSTLKNQTDELTIRVLGSGCLKCKRLSQDIMQVLAENNLAADFEHVTDLVEIASYGIFSTPALIVNGKVKSTGSVPPIAKLESWLVGIVT